MNIPVVMLRCLFLTILIEGIISLVLKVRKKDLVYVLLVNIMTNPLVVSIQIYLAYNYSIKLSNTVLYILEVLVVIVEGFVYSKTLKYKRINPFLLSLLLNGGSYFIGEIINKII